MEFQFLIGRLDTLQVCSAPNFYDTFQFLIGRLDTMKRIADALDYPMFQFLIGRLDTQGLPKFLIEHLQVSIPHR